MCRGGAPANEAAAPAARSSSPPPMRCHGSGLMAASIAVMAVALSLLAADQWMQFRAPRLRRPTITRSRLPTARAPDEVIRAVFSPTITLVELQAILDEAQLRIVSGPTEAGVYSLAANSSRPVSSSLALLRGHPKVRFAESTQPSADRSPGDAAMRRWAPVLLVARGVGACSNTPVRIESRALADQASRVAGALHHRGGRQRPGRFVGSRRQHAPRLRHASRSTGRARARAR